ncbi:hypothetical protein AC16_3947 [Escherichia coli 2-177-06_S3_C2]|nr:hypothetical protein ECP03047993_5547 [Escherichia coli P0304799.3]KDA57919.1 hypothetical protein AA98_2135 [Escherichia coli 2-011-08_S1_C1]KDX42984.1 hypothetical protein AC16_3947 [Escherichia coli 2-177-06_S3_C2]KEO16485.1 hypothetical protein AC44_0426 [Escherichia coli 2-177-06_S3_C3]
MSVSEYLQNRGVLNPEPERETVCFFTEDLMSYFIENSCDVINGIYLNA